MSNRGRSELGFAFALPRLMSRLTGRRARRAELSGVEVYGLGFLVFGISCVSLGRLCLSFLRPLAWRVFLLFLLPFALWAAFLLLYYVVSLLIALCRRLGWYTAVTNNSFQHVVFMSLTTLLAFQLLADESDWVKSLGFFWLGLLGLNLIATVWLNVSEAG